MGTTDFDRPSGQMVSDELQKYYDSEINLDALVDHGLVKKGQLDRRTNYYGLTEAGHEALRERRNWENQHIDL